MTGTAWTRLGAALAGLGVAAGAFGAHGLEKVLSERHQATFETAVRYQLVHALALLAVGLIAGRGRASGGLAVAGWCFFLGTLLFSGSLYGLALSGVGRLGAITPFGGVLFLAGWGALALRRPGPIVPEPAS